MIFKKFIIIFFFFHFETYLYANTATFRHKNYLTKASKKKAQDLLKINLSKVQKT